MSENFNNDIDTKQSTNDNHDATTHRLFSDDIKERQKNQRRMAAVWPTLSLILHIIGFILLVIFNEIVQISYNQV